MTMEEEMVELSEGRLTEPKFDLFVDSIEILQLKLPKYQI